MNDSRVSGRANASTRKLRLMRFPLLLLVAFNSFLLLKVPLGVDKATAEVAKSEQDLAQPEGPSQQPVKTSESAQALESGAATAPQTLASSEPNIPPEANSKFALQGEEAAVAPAKTVTAPPETPADLQEGRPSSSLLQSINDHQMQTRRELEPTRPGEPPPKPSRFDARPTDAGEQPKIFPHRQPHSASRQPDASTRSESNASSNGESNTSTRSESNASLNRTARGRERRPTSSSAAVLMEAQAGALTGVGEHSDDTAPSISTKPRRPQAPPRALVLRNAGPTTIHFLIDKQLRSLKAGESITLQAEQRRRVQFHRGNELGDASFVVHDGIFEFHLADEKGWKLSRRYQ